MPGRDAAVPGGPRRQVPGPRLRRVRHRAPARRPIVRDAAGAAGRIRSYQAGRMTVTPVSEGDGTPPPDAVAPAAAAPAVFRTAVESLNATRVRPEVRVEP